MTITAKTATRNSRHTRPVTIAAMAAGPLLLVAAEAISPVDTSGDTSAERVANIFEHTGRYGIAVLCLIAGLLLLVPATQGLRRLATGGRERLAGAGAAMAAAGFMLFSVASGALGVGPTAWASLPDDVRPEAVRFFEVMDDGKGAMMVPITGVLLPVIGLMVLALALRHSRRYPRWAGAALPLGWAVFLMGPGHIGRAAGALILLAGFAPAFNLTSTLEGRGDEYAGHDRRRSSREQGVKK